MQPYVGIALVITAGVLALLGTMLVERSAPRLGLVQPPNERSSHSRPTPRGGGIAIAVTVVIVAAALALLGASAFWAVAGLILAIGLLGFTDDMMDLSPALRFPVQIIVFSLLVWSTGPLPGLDVGFSLVLAGPLLAIVITIAGLWWLNLFNFMDGIDGIAGTHAILVLLGAVTIWYTNDPDAGLAPAFWLALGTGAATAGFLVRNWPPAKIFMGDAGSNALALAVFAIALATLASGQIGYQAWLLLPSAFIVDATITLLRRTARGERPWRAHRSHAYQHLSRRWDHKRATVVYCLWTALWSIPLALAAQHWASAGWFLVLVGYLPLVAFCIWAGAGRETTAGTANKPR
ncbi:glycosyltransferase family 4 protein [Devosia sp. FKR38]|uniref:MraY family glycosyltransferase n=1 Tax=Devosia sp. FKR38 TaxID=2562312 RepID=UPI0010C04AF4|nr:glycosyltransferase family 4 protein [Devosia sp. FKR38]